MTRNPLSFQGAVIDPGDIVDEILDGICADPVPEQYSIYLPYPSLQAALEVNQASIPGLLGNPELELDPGYDGIPKLKVEVINASPGDGEAVRLLDEVVDDVQVPGILLNYFYRKVGLEPNVVTPSIRLSCGGFWRHRLIQVCLAVPQHYDEKRIRDFFHLRSGSASISLGSALSLQDLRSSLSDLTSDMPHWTPPCSAFDRLGELSSYSTHLLWLATISLSELSLPSDPTELVIGSKYTNIKEAETVVVGPIKLTPSLEHDRVLAEAEHKSDLQDELNDALSGNDKPLLEPDREYVLTLNYQKTLAGNVSAGAPVVHTFRTSPTPPQRLYPYLLATYPDGASRRSMPTNDAPAVLISSHDILRILDAYGTKLKVQITHDGGAPLTDSTGTIDWKQGESFVPAELRLPHPPKGIISARNKGWNSAVMDAIYDAIENGELPCITANPIDRALWIGFDVLLHSMSSYHVRLDLLDAANNPVFGAEARALLCLLLYDGLYPTMSALADRVANGQMKRRARNTQLPVFEFSRPDREQPAISVVGDKAMEDALAEATGERQSYSGQPDITVLWSNESGTDRPAAIVLRTNDPY